MLGELNEQHLQEVALQLEIPVDFVRKDYFVTKAIQALTNVEDDNFELVFQGGTSLSKGFQVINRLSEDIDFRVIQKPKLKKVGTASRRKKLRDFRYTLIHALKDAGFNILTEDIKVVYEGRFMRIRAAFFGSEKLFYLKPHVVVECFFGELALKKQSTRISSLVKMVLADTCSHVFFPVDCVSLDETAAEKWVALTRRVAETQLKERQSDKHLVRHLYDLCQLHRKDLLVGKYQFIVKNIIEKESILFKKRNPAYANDPLNTSELAIELLFQDRKWQNHWDIFMDQMVYEKDKPSFNQALDSLQILSKDIFGVLQES